METILLVLTILMGIALIVMELSLKRMGDRMGRAHEVTTSSLAHLSRIVSDLGTEIDDVENRLDDMQEELRDKEDEKKDESQRFDQWLTSIIGYNPYSKG